MPLEEKEVHALLLCVFLTNTSTHLHISFLNPESPPPLLLLLNEEEEEEELELLLDTCPLGPKLYVLSR